jgi:DNA-binding LacI/PurR family transcriptional regulator
MQVHYLAAYGHRRIGFARAPTHARIPSAPRAEGAQGACRELALPEPVIVVLDDEPTSAGCPPRPAVRR